MKTPPSPSFLLLDLFRSSGPERRTFDFTEWISGRRGFTFMSSLFVVMVVIVVAWLLRDNGALFKTSALTPALTISYQMDAIFFSLFSALGFLGIWKYVLDQPKITRQMRDATYPSLVFAMMMWTLLALVRLAYAKYHDAELTREMLTGITLEHLCSLFNSLGFVIPIRYFHFRNHRDRNNIRILLSQRRIIVGFSFAVAITLLVYIYYYVSPKYAGNGYILPASVKKLVGLPDVLVSLLLVALFLRYLPTLFKERGMKGPFIRMFLYFVLGLTLCYQVYNWYSQSGGEITETNFENYYPFAIGYSYRYTLVLVFYALTISFIVTKLKENPVEHLLDVIFQAKGNWKHDSKTDNSIWRALSEFAGFADHHNTFLALFSNARPHENTYVAPPYSLSRSIASGDRSAFPLFGVLFISLSVLIRHWREEVPDEQLSSLFEKNIVRAKLGFQSLAEWREMNAVLKNRSLVVGRNENQLEFVFKVLFDLLNGLSFDKAERIELLKRIEWIPDRFRLRLFFHLEKTAIDRLYITLQENLTARAGRQRYGDHDVSSNLLMLSDLLNPHMFQTSLFGNIRTEELPFRFYRDAPDGDFFILEFASLC